MSELKLTQHPEITGLLSVLEQNGLHKEQNEVKCLAAYIDEMEGQLSAMNEELMQLHREISTIRDSSLKVRCEKLIFGAENSFGRQQQPLGRSSITAFVWREMRWTLLRQMARRPCAVQSLL